MIRKVSLLLLLAAVFVLAPLAADAATSVIMLKNNTGAELYHIYMSSSEVDNWEEDILGEQTLENGETLRISLTGSYKEFDLRVEDAHGNHIEWFKLPGTLKEITIKGDGTAEYK